MQAETPSRSSAAASGSSPELLLVVLDGPGAARRGGVRVHPELLERAALPQQVPALVEADLELGEPLLVGVGRVPLRLGVPQRVLLVDELLDPAVNLVVVHPPNPSDGVAPA